MRSWRCSASSTMPARPSSWSRTSRTSPTHAKRVIRMKDGKIIYDGPSPRMVKEQEQAALAGHGRRTRQALAAESISRRSVRAARLRQGLDGSKPFDSESDSLRGKRFHGTHLAGVETRNEEPASAQAPLRSDRAGHRLRRGRGHLDAGDRRRLQPRGPGTDPRSGGNQHHRPLGQAQRRGPGHGRAGPRASSTTG